MPAVCIPSDFRFELLLVNEVAGYFHLRIDLSPLRQGLLLTQLRAGLKPKHQKIHQQCIHRQQHQAGGYLNPDDAVLVG